MVRIRSSLTAPRPVATGILLLTLLLARSDSAAQQLPASLPGAAVSSSSTSAAVRVHTLPPLAHGSPVPQTPAVARAVSLPAVNGWKQTGDGRLRIAGGVGGALIGAAAGVLVACHFNRDSYGIFCLGQSDTKLAIGAVVGGTAGGALGAYLFRRRR